jgi:hypothetical protein
MEPEKSYFRKVRARKMMEQIKVPVIKTSENGLLQACVTTIWHNSQACILGQSFT